MTVRGALRPAALRADWASASARSATPRAAHLLVAPAIQGRQRPQRSRDSRLGLDRLRRRTGRSPGQPNDAHTGRHRPQSQGGSHPPSQQWSGARRSSQADQRCTVPCLLFPPWVGGGGGAICGAIGGSPACRRASSAWLSCAVVSVPDLGPWAWSIW
jgi:hypothetical protein